MTPVRVFGSLDIARQFGGAYGLGVIYAQAMVGKGPND
jgi:hypothetical protein